MSLLGAQPDTAANGIVSYYPGTVVHGESALRAIGEKEVREPEGIQLTGERGAECRRPGKGETLPQVTLGEEIHLDPDGPARRVLGLERMNVLAA